MFPTVFVIEDDVPMRRSLAALAQSVGASAQTFGSAEQFLEAFEPDRPGCVIVDLRLPGMNGVELAGLLRERDVKIPIIVLTAYGDVTTAADGMRLGLLDYLEKPVRPAELAERIRSAIEQDRTIRRHRKVYQNIRSRLDQLTPREAQTLRGIVDGKASKQIAYELGVSQKTVDKHRAQVMAKMGAVNAVELTRLVMWAEHVTHVGLEAALPPPPVEEHPQRS